MVFPVCKYQEKFKEQNLGLYVVFIDLTKAFDAVNREALWTILSKFGCLRIFENLIHLFHDDMTGLILSSGETSEPFQIWNCVKQGCPLASMLFNLFFNCMISQGVRDLEHRVYPKYRLDGLPFDLHYLNAKTKVVGGIILGAHLLTTVLLWCIISLTSRWLLTNFLKLLSPLDSPST